jgi:hypothetical protein
MPPLILKCWPPWRAGHDGVANVRLATQLKEGLEELSTSRVRLIAAKMPSVVASSETCMTGFSRRS